MSSRMRRLVGVAGVGALAALSQGCVTLAQYDELKERNRELTFTLEHADDAIAQKEERIQSLQQELATLRTQLSAANERHAGAVRALEEARATFDDNYQRMLSELRENSGPGMQISQYGGLILEDSILFNAGHYELRPEGQRLLDPVIAQLQNSQYAGCTIEIAGHTDSDPIRASQSRVRTNWELASKRAEAVLGYMIQHGIPEGRVFISGYSSMQPLDPGTTPDAKRRNRRVEIRLHQPAPGSDAQYGVGPEAARPERGG